MGKRKTQEEEKTKRAYLLKKIKRLERKIEEISSDSSEEEHVNNSPDLNEHTIIDPPEMGENIEPEIEIEDTPMEQEELPQEEALDDQVLEIFGVGPQPTKVGGEMHNEIAHRWDAILRKGLTKEEKDRIEQENPPFTNIKIMLPPKLNAEVSAAINEMIRKRDQIIYRRQQQVATALSCLGSGLQMCLKDIQNNKMDIIKKLNDASRLMCDSMYLDTRGRRSILISAINKDMQSLLQQSESETYLFGEDLAEKLRTAKSVQKSGQELKVAETKKFTPRHNTYVPKPNASKNKTFNWRGPPRTEGKKRGGPSSRVPGVDRKWEEWKRNQQRRK